MRVRSPLSRARRPRKRFCDRCEAETKEGKPLCASHVLAMPYVQDLLDRMAERERDDQLACERGWQTIDLEGITTQEVLLAVTTWGPMTLARLAREVQLDYECVDLHVLALIARGRLAMRRRRRGGWVVCLHRPGG